MQPLARQPPGTLEPPKEPPKAAGACACRCATSTLRMSSVLSSAKCAPAHLGAPLSPPRPADTARATLTLRAPRCPEPTPPQACAAPRTVQTSARWMRCRRALALQDLRKVAERRRELDHAAQQPVGVWRRGQLEARHRRARPEPRTGENRQHQGARPQAAAPQAAPQAGVPSWHLSQEPAQIARDTARGAAVSSLRARSRACVRACAG